jgi:hypothetical protein
MSREPEALLHRWISRVNERDLDGLLALYDDDAVLIPTFSNRILRGPARIAGYFEMLCSREALSISLRERTLIVQPIAQPVFALCGIYCWRFAVDDELLNFEARFSYVLDADRPKPILQHHSSQIPRTL